MVMKGASEPPHQPKISINSVAALHFTNQEAALTL
jgi:hypothetical protein